tara:strand:+ start:288 stop:407 length:120 start_codon:yes stop_codon:yes gene_type:complete
LSKKLRKLSLLQKNTKQIDKFRFTVVAAATAASAAIDDY